MGNLPSGDITRLTLIGGVETPRRFIKYPVFSQATSAFVSGGAL